ncbi:ribulose bisphosphate carboxylase small chain, chloroplastic-like [Pistacia vera]|uniref:ribulose bisphosphate carboxylase small chain, chloroplastic-like n=1 Tax=Pistacia vera TaxID=55513 RepID=UPI001263D49F|nr:ribulose bisphosphate carboxylase small chain, chloroplastic-like [Pistacia vera]
MATQMISTAATAATINGGAATAAQPSLVAPFSGLKSMSPFPVSRKSNSGDMRSLPSNGGRVQCMQVWPPLGKKKFETLSYLLPLSREQLAKEVEYLLRQGWVPCLEFELQHGFVYRENHRSPGYYDGRYWTMWKLPMFGCTDSSQVLKELDEAIKAYPEAFVRIIGFDNVRQVQCISFIAYKPPGV